MSGLYRNFKLRIENITSHVLYFLSLTFSQMEKGPFLIVHITNTRITEDLIEVNRKSQFLLYLLLSMQVMNLLQLKHGRISKIKHALILGKRLVFITYIILLREYIHSLQLQHAAISRIIGYTQITFLFVQLRRCIHCDIRDDRTQKKSQINQVLIILGMKIHIAKIVTFLSGQKIV